MIKTGQSVSAKMYHVLFTKILQGGDTVGLFITKDVLEFVIKALDKCTYKEFLKIPF